MSAEQQDDQAQQQADFHAGYNGDQPAPDADPVEPEAPEAEAEAAEEEPNPEGEEPEGDQGEEEEPVLAGFTESQIKSLLERSAKVDALEAQLRKANGKLGELNGAIQEFRSKSGKSQEAPAQEFTAPELEGRLSETASMYSDIDELIVARSRQIAAEIVKQSAGSGAPAPDANALRDEISQDIRAEMEMRLMDTMHNDWRDVVQSSDFELWLATQPDQIRQTYAETNSAQDLAGIVGDFKTWKTHVSDRSQRNKKRLESALTPSGVPSRKPPAASADDEFRAGFYGT